MDENKLQGDSMKKKKLDFVDNCYVRLLGGMDRKRIERIIEAIMPGYHLAKYRKDRGVKKPKVIFYEETLRKEGGER
jgi:hypothetical protein